MKCRELLKHLSDYIDRDLDPSICRHIDSHMKGCKPCIAFIETLRKTKGILQRQPKAAPSQKLRSEVLLEHEGITQEVVKSFLVHLISHDRPMHELIEPTRKDIREDFNADFQGMAAEPVEYEALLEARETLIKHLHARLTADEKKFLVSVKEGKPDWPLLGVDDVERLPAVQWKLKNIAKMDRKKHRDQLGQLRRALGL